MQEALIGGSRWFQSLRMDLPLAEQWPGGSWRWLAGYGCGLVWGPGSPGCSRPTNERRGTLIMTEALMKKHVENESPEFSL